MASKTTIVYVKINSEQLRGRLRDAVIQAFRDGAIAFEYEPNTLPSQLFFDWPGITDEHLVGDLPRGRLPE